MKKIATITTLTAGIGAAYFGTTAHHADAAEFNQSNNQSYNYNTAQTSTSNTTSERSASGNLYTAGQCTWYVYDKVGGKVETLETGHQLHNKLVIQSIIHQKLDQFYNHQQVVMVTLLMLKVLVLTVQLQFLK